MSKSKKKAIGILSLALAGVITITGTLAYLTRETEKRSNKFTFSASGLNAEMTESDWDGIIDYEYADDGTSTPIYGYTKDGDDNDIPVYGYTDGDITKPVTDKADIDATTKRPNNVTYGDELAQNMVPGSEAPKNPVIHNTGDNSDVWAAAKVTYVYASGTNKGKALSLTDLSAVEDIIVIDYNSTDWELQGSATGAVSKTFYYKEALSAVDPSTPNTYDSTEALFTKLTVSNTATTEQLTKLEAMGGIVVYIEGFIAQGEVATDYAGFKTWAETGVVFTNTPTTETAVEI